MGARKLVDDEDFDAAPITNPREERAKVLAYGLEDFRRFCGLLEIQPKKGGERIPFKLSPVQRKYCADRTARDIILKPRQIGQTTLECARDVWFFLRRKGAKVVVVCQSDTELRAFTAIADKIRIFFEALQRAGFRFDFGKDAAGGVWTLPKRDASLRILQAGASEAAAEKKGRGETIGRLHITEAAFFEYADATFNSLLESIPGPEEGSEIVNESTPNGVGGFYYEQWQGAVKGSNGFAPHFFHWWDNPEYELALEPGEAVEPVNELESALLANGIRPGQLKWYRRKLAEKNENNALMRQEYPSDPATCFLVSGRHFFDVDKLNALIGRARPPVRREMHGALRIWKDPEPGAEYIIPVDTAEGESEDGKEEHADYSAAPVLNRATGEHVATLHGRIPAHEFATMLAALARTYNNALVAVERNNHGHAVLLALSRIEKYRRLYRHDDDKLGWPTTTVTRPIMLDALDDAVRKNYFSSLDAITLEEMQKFVVPNNGKPQAAKGANDDLVMAMAIGWAVRGKPLRKYGGQTGSDVLSIL